MNICMNIYLDGEFIVVIVLGGLFGTIEAPSLSRFPLLDAHQDLLLDAQVIMTTVLGFSLIIQVASYSGGWGVGSTDVEWYELEDTWGVETLMLGETFKKTLEDSLSNQCSSLQSACFGAVLPSWMYIQSV